MAWGSLAIRAQARVKSILALLFALLLVAEPALGQPSSDAIVRLVNIATPLSFTPENSPYTTERNDLVIVNSSVESKPWNVDNGNGVSSVLFSPDLLYGHSLENVYLFPQTRTVAKIAVDIQEQILALRE